MTENRDKRTLLIGLDGATWKIINPLIAEGKLPNIKSLMDKGAHGILMSDEKMVSPSVWTTILTGKNPQKHGILDFMTMQNKLKAKRIWDIFEDYQKRVGIAGFLMTWPPKLKNNGFMIPDHFAPDNAAIPPEVSFLRELTNRRHRRHGLTISTLVNYFFNAFKFNIDFFTLLKAFSVFLESKFKHEDYLNLFHKEINIFMLFLEKVFTTLLVSYRPDFSAIYLAGTDVLAHKYWNFYKPEDFKDVDPKLVKKYGNVIPDVYIASDKIIGRILKTFEKHFENFDVFIVSDHGFQTCHDGKFRPSAKISFLLDKFGMKDRFNYTKIGHSTIVTPIADSSEIEQQYLVQLKDKIEHIATLDKNIPIFESQLIENYMKISAQPRWKGYQFTDAINLNGSEYKVEDVFDKGVLLTGMHEREGVIIMSGDNIKKNYYITGAEVSDVTPTVLALNNMPIARDMDGKVLQDAIKAEYWKNSALKYIDTYGAPEDIHFSEEELEKVKESEAELESKLRSLGYM